MTKQEKIDLIAEKIMGWHKSEVTRHLWWISTEGHLTYRIRDYNPRINISQAIDALEIFCKKKECRSRMFITQYNETSCIIISRIIGTTIGYCSSNEGLSVSIFDALIEAIEGGKG